ncbi:hypothetical protein MKZ38_003396 [Zalerion maritima]|uniref:Uncharacterized protein n=1 Tax=Zalerion maritima TaxID=339359 RepID=A0AAD5WRV8_9PEZI|nr:hypothetical protein MKZ38_003396 [Zalerion maritima]
MLALAASHLTLSNPGGPDYSRQALSHRISSINRLNEALSVPCTTKEEGDARYATTMALTFQSSYMPDGMSDFVRMMRGCAVVARTAMGGRYEDSMWAIFSQEEHIRRAKGVLLGGGGGGGLGGEGAGMEGGIQDVPLDEEIVKGYLDTVRRLAPLCVSITEVAYLAAIERTMKVARRSAVQAQGEFTRMYTMSNDLGNDEFVSLVDPSNHGAKLLLIHVYLCEHVLQQAYLIPILPCQHLRQEIIYHWLRRVIESVPDELKKYGDWAMRFVRERVYRPPGEQGREVSHGHGHGMGAGTGTGAGFIGGGSVTELGLEGLDVGVDVDIDASNLWNMGGSEIASSGSPTQHHQQQHHGFDGTGTEGTSTVGSPDDHLHMDYGSAMNAAMEIDGLENPFRVDGPNIWGV